MDSAYGCIYEDLYRRHWWFRARERILVSVLKRLALPQPADILDVGCGNGLFFDELARFGSVRGIEVDRSLVPPDSRYRDRMFDRPLGDPQYAAMQFDLITALDVIEHIEDDGQAVADMLSMLRPGGKLVVTVPASMSLWDHHDVINMHYRRYTAESLRRLLTSRGRVLELRHLFHALFLPKFAVRKFNQFFHRDAIQHGMPAAPVNRFMELACLFEYNALKGLCVPFGTSLLAVVEPASAR
jgi:SAM-dependent methyltransferase